jgi:hypothetical protein
VDSDDRQPTSEAAPDGGPEAADLVAELARVSALLEEERAYFRS